MFGTYVLPAQPLICAVVVIAVVGALTVSGVRWSPGTAWLLVGGTLAVLAVVVVVGLLGPGGSTGVSASPVSDTPVPVQVITGPVGVVTAAGLVFFAFAGYSRVATIGEELRDPERSLRRSMVIVFTILTLTYVAVAGALLVGLGADRVAAEHAPLVALVDTGQAPALGVLVRIGAAVASGAALLSVLVVTGRTMRKWPRRASCRGCSPRSAAGRRRGSPTSRARCWPSSWRCSRDRSRRSRCPRARRSCTTR
ncbi:amino acid permease [Pseudonocardia benzenivorans]